jgi:hypothetical protein
MSAFTPNSDRESRFPRKVMSALPPKADMCSAVADVRFGPAFCACGELATSRQPTTMRVAVLSETPFYKIRRPLVIKRPRRFRRARGRSIVIEGFEERHF